MPPNRRARTPTVLAALAISILFGAVAEAQERRDTTRARPFVAGGRGDRPYLADLAGRLALGGYAEGHFVYQREDGITEDLTFLAKRFNLFFNSQISDFIRFGAELEFEDAAEEIKLEYMTVDLLVNRSFAARAGMILIPLGRFNLAHDSPRNPFTDRPFVSTEILSVALSQPGLGGYGTVPLGGTARLTYEAYAVNGFDDRILDAEDGLRLSAGRANFENNNRRLSVVGRIAYSPRANLEVGLSGMHGQYNESTRDGETIDDGRTLSIGALDWDVDVGAVQVLGEVAVADIAVPPALEGLLATGQWGLYTDVVVPFWRGRVTTMPRSRFEARLRYDYVDFDRNIPGDNASRVSLGVSFRPTSDTALKLDYFRGRTHDRFNNRADQAGLLFSAATYF